MNDYKDKEIKDNVLYEDDSFKEYLDKTSNNAKVLLYTMKELDNKEPEELKDIYNKILLDKKKK